MLPTAHGTPDSTEGIAPFYTRIRRGRPPSPKQLAELEGRYAASAVSRLSPFALRRRSTAVRAALDADALPGRYVVSFGAKHTDPLIEEAAALLRGGRRRTCDRPGADSPLVPTMGSQEYLECGPSRLLDFDTVRARAAWYAEASLVAAPGRPRQMRAGGHGRRRQPQRRRRAHQSDLHRALTARARCGTGRHLPQQLADRRDLVAEGGRASRTTSSRGRARAEPPSPGSAPTCATRAPGRPTATDGGVVVCPIGFVADHLEVLYDLDIEVADLAATHRPGYAWTASLNDDPPFIATLADPDRRGPRSTPECCGGGRRRRRRHQRPGPRPGS